MRSEQIDSLLVTARVFKVAVKSFHAAFEGGGDLGERAAEDGQLRRAEVRGRDLWEKIVVGSGDLRRNRLDGGEVF